MEVLEEGKDGLVVSEIKIASGEHEARINESAFSAPIGGDAEKFERRKADAEREGEKEWDTFFSESIGNEMAEVTDHEGKPNDGHIN